MNISHPFRRAFCTFRTASLGLLLAFSLCFVPNASAQEAVSTTVPATPTTHTAPKAPFVAMLPARGAWKITISEESDKKGRGEGGSTTPAVLLTLPISIEVTKFDEIRRAVVAFPDGSRRTYDHRGDRVLTSVNGAWRVVFYRVDAPPYPCSSEQFPLTDWLGVETFKDRVRYKGADCFHYDDGAGREAWIDAATLLPVTAQQGNCRLSYEFLPAPSGPLRISPDEAAVIFQIDHPPTPAP